MLCCATDRKDLRTLLASRAAPLHAAQLSLHPHRAAQLSPHPRHSTPHSSAYTRAAPRCTAQPTPGHCPLPACCHCRRCPASCRGSAACSLHRDTKEIGARAALCCVVLCSGGLLTDAVAQLLRARLLVV